MPALDITTDHYIPLPHVQRNCLERNNRNKVLLRNKDAMSVAARQGRERVNFGFFCALRVGTADTHRATGSITPFSILLLADVCYNFALTLN
jgi:hypothetical protein